MRIGLVYDLRDDYLAAGYTLEQTAEFDSRETVDALADALAANGHSVERIGHGRALATMLSAGSRWDLVFSIAEGLKGRCREAQVPALCELFDQPYAFSDPLTMAATLDKAVAKRLVRDAGLPTAPFAILESPGQAAFVDLPWPVFVKPVAEGTGKGCEAASRVVGRMALTDAAARLIARFDQPAIVEPYLSGREFTVGIVGAGPSARVLGTMEIVLERDADSGVYSYTNKEECESRVRYSLVDDSEARRAARTALACYRALGCRDAGRVDLRSDGAAEPQFLEVNPIAGLHPTHSDLPIIAELAGHGYQRLIGDIVASASVRISAPARAAA